MSEHHGPLIYDEDVLTFVAMGFCNIGDGRIARVDMQRPLDAVADAARRGKIPGITQLSSATDGHTAERLYRQYCAPSINVGRRTADLFPPSAKTTTCYIRLNEHEQRQVERLREEADLYWGANTTDAGLNGYKSKHDYSQDALF